MAAFRRLGFTARAMLLPKGTRASLFPEKCSHLEAASITRVWEKKCRPFSAGSVTVEEKTEKEEPTTVQKYISYLKSTTEREVAEEVSHEAGRNAERLRKSMDMLNTSLSREEMDECLQSVASGFEASDPKLGKMYFRLGQIFDMQKAEDKALVCCEKALEAFDVEKNPMEHVFTLHLAASVHQKLEDHDAAIEKLRKAIEIGNEKLNEAGRKLMVPVGFTLASALSVKERHEEAVEVCLSTVAAQQKFLDKDHPELADGYLKVAEALAQCFRVPEAIEYCEKALSIHGGKGSLAEAASRRLLAILYKGVGEVAKAVEQNKIVREILMKNDRNKEARLIDIGIAVCQIGLKEYDDALETFKGIIADPEDTGLVKGLAHINSAKICLIKGETDEASAHSEKANVILRKNKSTSTMVAEGFSELAGVFESLKDYETAMDLYKEALKIFADTPGQANAVAGTQAQIGSMCYFLEKYKEAVPYLERSAKIMESIVGKEHQAYGSVMNQLGVTNMEMKNLVVAADQFEKAKVAYLKSCGPGHEDTIAVNHNLVVVYSSLYRWDKAMKCQGEVLEELERRGAGAERLQQAREVMKELQTAIVTRAL